MARVGAVILRENLVAARQGREVYYLFPSVRLSG